MSKGQAKTPLEDLRRDTLKHYEELSKESCSFCNTVPRAINEYFDNRKHPIIEEELDDMFGLLKWTSFFIFTYLLLVGIGVGVVLFFLD
jgi:hypothetical protein